MNSKTRLKLISIGATLATFLFLGATASLTNEPPTSKLATEPVTKLLEDRRAVLRQLVKVQVAEYRVGKVDFNAIARARKQLLSAELELANDRKERIQLLESFVMLTTDFEKIAEQQYRAGKTSQGDVLESKATRLEAQVALLRERGK